MIRISTSTLNSSLMNAAMQAESTYGQASTQEATGLVSQDYGGLGSSAGHLLSLEDQLNQVQNYAAEATSVGNKVQSMYSSIGDMVTAMTSLEATLSSAMSANASGLTNTSLQSTGTGALNKLTSALNSQYGSDYLFSGTATQTAPVSLTSYAPTSASDTSYYQGTSTTNSVRLSSSQTLSYGVTANNSAFSQALYAAYSVSQVSTTDTAGLQAAYDAAKTAVTELSSLQANVSQSSSTLTNTASRQASVATYLTTAISDIKNVDTAAITAKVSQYQTQLTASYSAIAKVAKISLATYL